MLRIAVLALMMLISWNATALQAHSDKKTAVKQQPTEAPDVTSNNKAYTKESPLFIQQAPSEEQAQQAKDDREAREREQKNNLWIGGIQDAITLILAFITFFLARYTYKLWGSAENATKLELRAYISVGEEPKGRILEEDKAPEFMPIVVNKGKTPAKGLYCVSWISILPKNLTKKSQLPKPKTKRIRSKGDLGAGDPSEYFCQGTFLLTKEDLANISGWGDTRLYFYGTVRFRDVFEKRGWTNFCFQIQVKENGSVRGWHISPCHNDSGYED